MDLKFHNKINFTKSSFWPCSIDAIAGKVPMLIVGHDLVNFAILWQMPTLKCFRAIRVHCSEANQLIS